MDNFVRICEMKEEVDGHSGMDIIWPSEVRESVREANTDIIEEEGYDHHQRRDISDQPWGSLGFVVTIASHNLSCSGCYM